MAIDPFYRRHVQFKYASTSQLGRVTQAGLIPASTGPSETPDRVLPSYALVYTVAGKAEYQDSQGGHTELVPGDLLFLFPGIPHTYKPVAPGSWTEFYIIFEGPVFDLWLTNGLLDPEKPVHHCEPVDLWLRRLEAVTGAPRETEFEHPLLEVCRLQQVLADMLIIKEGGSPEAREMRMTSQACAILESDLGKDMDIPGIARQMGVNHETFRKIFTKKVGMPPARYRNARIIDRACELMQRGQMKDAQIAQKLGFCDEYHFSRLFKTVVGVSPRIFKKMFLQIPPARTGRDRVEEMKPAKNS